MDLPGTEIELKLTIITLWRLSVKKKVKLLHHLSSFAQMNFALISNSEATLPELPGHGLRCDIHQNRKMRELSF